MRFVRPGVGDEQTMALLSNIWDVYGAMSAIQLSNLTHHADGPWHRVYTENPNRKGVVIPDALIKEYFDSVTVS